MPLERGSTFLNDEMQDLPAHLWIVVSDPSIDCTRTVVVNISTWRGRFDDDPTCVLERHHHPFIRHTSYVVCRAARVLSLDNFRDLRGANLLHPHQPTPESTLSAIYRGFTVSEDVEGWILDILSAQGLL